MPAKIEISPQTREQVIALRRENGLADHEIAHRLNLSEWAVIRILRAHRKAHPNDPLPANRWSPISRAMRRMALANRLVEENQLSRRAILTKTGYKSWHSLLEMILLYRKRTGLGPMRHRSGWVKVAGTHHVRIVLCADAIHGAGWKAGQRISWTAMDGEIWLCPEPRLTKPHANWKASDLDAEVYWERYGKKIAWREIAAIRKISITKAITMANRHASKYPWLPREERKANRGVVRVMRINKSTLRLNLNRAAALVGFMPCDQAHWEARPNHVLVIKRRAVATAQAM